MSSLPCPSHERLADCASGALDAAAVAVSRRHDPAECQVKELISEALGLVLTAPETGPG